MEVKTLHSVGKALLLVSGCVFSVKTVSNVDRQDLEGRSNFKFKARIKESRQAGQLSHQPPGHNDTWYWHESSSSAGYKDRLV